MTLESVRKFADVILKKNIPIHVLVNNGNNQIFFKSIETVGIWGDIHEAVLAQFCLLSHFFYANYICNR